MNNHSEAQPLTAFVTVDGVEVGPVQDITIEKPFSYSRYMQEERDETQIEIDFYREVLKYTKHSKRRHVVERKLNSQIEWQQFQADVTYLTQEEIEAKYPHYF